MKLIKRYIRYLIRSLLQCKDNERISDAVDRHKTRIARKINKRKVTEKELFQCLVRMGVSKGDVIMVHASWRKFYNFEGTPKSLIRMLLDIIGPDGTLLMPCYGNDKEYFDILNTPSYAGVLSEEFRKMPGVIRSKCSHFSVCGYGKLAEELTRHHVKSEFGFDHFSPYYLFSQTNGSKIIKLGMGKYPIKMTLIHCVEYIYKDIYPYFREYLSNRYEAIIIDESGERSNRQMLEGVGGKLYRKNIKAIYKSIPQNKCHYQRIANIDIRIFNAKEGYKEIAKAIGQGKSMLNPPKTKKDSFIPIR